MKADYISPHEGTWYRNDFTIGERYVTDDHVFTCVAVNNGSYQDLELTVEWVDRPGAGDRVWPNMQWIALNWEENNE